MNPFELKNASPTINSPYINNFIAKGLEDNDSPYQEPEELVLDCESDSDEDIYLNSDEESNSDSQNPNIPTKSKYSFATQLEIVQHLNSGKTYKYIRHNYKKLTSNIEITRIREYISKGKYLKVHI